MRLEREAGADGPLIKGFSGGGYRIDDKVFTALLITPLSVHGWSPPPIDTLGEADVASLIAIDPAPEFLLIGTGGVLVRPPVAFIRAIEARGIGVEVMDSRAAARAWSILRQEGRWIAGALYPLDNPTD